MNKDEKKITIKYEDVARVRRAREIWFKELLEKFLPEALDKMMKRREISIPPKIIE